MSENILILDVGNSNTKCFVYHVDRTYSAPYGTYAVTCLYEDVQKTNRGHPWDLSDTCRNMLSRAIQAHQPRYGTITAFGDAFVYYDPENNGRPRFVFADEKVDDYELDRDYAHVGFPTGNIEITGVRALRAKHRAEWKHIVPVNIALGRELGGNANWWRWDLTQASATGEYNLRADEWFNKGGFAPCQPHDEVGMFKCMSLLAGGLDNAFVDTTEHTPYIIAGTWLVVSTVHDEFRPTETRRKHGIRWFLSGNGRYLAQTVRRSKRPIPPELPEQILGDLQMMGLGGEKYQKIRVIGVYSKELCAKLNESSSRHFFDFQFCDLGEQFKETAIYTYKHKESLIE